MNICVEAIHVAIEHVARAVAAAGISHLVWAVAVVIRVALSSLAAGGGVGAELHGHVESVEERDVGRNRGSGIGWGSILLVCTVVSRSLGLAPALTGSVEGAVGSGPYSASFCAGGDVESPDLAVVQLAAAAG